MQCHAIFNFKIRYTKLISPRCAVLEKARDNHFVKESLAFCQTRRFAAVFTTVHYKSVLQVFWMRSTPSQNILIISVALFILSRLTVFQVGACFPAFLTPAPTPFSLVSLSDKQYTITKLLITKMSLFSSRLWREIQTFPSASSIRALPSLLKTKTHTHA
jgi:hypothetical protein